MATFHDFLLMKELVESLESQTRDNEGRRAEETKSDPENFFLVVDQEAWKRVQEACKREKLVVAMEITNQFDDTCRRVRRLFTDLAKEFDSIPFFRVVTGPGRQLTMEQICHDVGQVSQLPTILLLYYDAVDHIKRKSYQGEKEIREALKNGQLKQMFKDFIDERLEQKAMESAKAAEMEYSERLKRISRKLSKDESVKGKPRLVTADSVPPCVPEGEEDGNSSTETNSNKNLETDSETHLEHHSLDSKKDSVAEPDGVAEPDLTASTTAVPEPIPVPVPEPIPVQEPNPVPESIPAPEPSDVPEPTNEVKLAASHIIDIAGVKVGKRIGRGGFGEVYEAKWNEKQVAAKVCSGNLIEHFPREVAILASLPPHPYVIMFFGLALSTDKISTLIVTELATNGSLFNYLHVKKEVPSADQCLAWALQVASAMAHLHSHNVIHRDLKSGNILLSFGMVAKVCDFGTARSLAQTTKQSVVAGTYRWMSPEVMEDVEANINNKCDVFSYGMVLYEIYACKIPYAGLPNAMVGAEVLGGKRPPVPDTMPPFLRPLLLRCWEYDSKKRPTFQDIVVAISTGSFKDEN